MLEDIFKPKYRVRYRIGGPILTMFGGSLILMVLFFDVKDPSLAWLGTFMLLLGVSGSIVWINDGFIRIVFQENKVVFFRRFISPIICLYSELTDLGFTKIQFGQRKISLMMMENSSELVGKFHELVEKGVISPSQINGNISLRETMVFKVSVISLVPIFLVSLLLDWFLSRYFDINLNDGIVFVLASLMVIPVVYILAIKSNNTHSGEK